MREPIGPPHSREPPPAGGGCIDAPPLCSRRRFLAAAFGESGLSEDAEGESFTASTAPAAIHANVLSSCSGGACRPPARRLGGVLLRALGGGVEPPLGDLAD